jgi:RNA polymerase sigma-70 factor (ECF subfamily)
MSDDLEHIFNLATHHDRKAQRALYEMFSGKMLFIAKSYTTNLHDAEDVLSMAFYKAFTRIAECRQAKSFPFWLRKIVINESIDCIRKNQNLLYVDFDVEDESCESWNDYFDDDHVLDINLEETLKKMPIGYKIVFNLYVFEEKKHQEIADILNISEGTSKSQLSKAKNWLREFFKHKENEKFIKK